MAGEPPLAARVHGLLAAPGPSPEAGSAVILESLPYLFVGIHHEGPALRHRLADGPALEQQQAALLAARLQADPGLGPEQGGMVGRQGRAIHREALALGEVQGPVEADL